MWLGLLGEVCVCVCVGLVFPRVVCCVFVLCVVCSLFVRSFVRSFGSLLRFFSYQCNQRQCNCVSSIVFLTWKNTSKCWFCTGSHPSIPFPASCSASSAKAAPLVHQRLGWHDLGCRRLHVLAHLGCLLFCYNCFINPCHTPKHTPTHTPKPTPTIRREAIHNTNQTTQRYVLGF